MLDSTAKMIGTVGIWTSFAVTMAFGLCRMNFSGETALPAFILSVAMVSLAAVVATGLVWRSQSAAAGRTAATQTVL